MIENNNEVSKDLEKALQVLKQAQQRVANEKKNRTRRNAKPRTTTKFLTGFVLFREKEGYSVLFAC
ncbi:hypothetical protein [Roseburia sp. 1XD42-69]|uniref:hypothetical protein n=1 Tax=Roseburia sp. 1XD42-69 TaxID=2320088 RepID=UPI0018F2F079|nr:hypothetical protein [Roseburia sp. 1XD42-69]